MRRVLHSKLRYTTSFRLALQSAIFSIIGASLVFGIIYHATKGTVRNAIDASVIADKADIISDMHDDNDGVLAEVKDALSEGQGTFYALTGRNGGVLAGNLLLSPQIRQNWQSWRTIGRDDGITLPPHIKAIRGLAVPFPNGETLYIAENATALVALDNLILVAFLAIFGVTLILGLLSGLLVARASLKRVEAIGDTSRTIMSGDLSQRIILNGSGDEFDRLSENLNLMLNRIHGLMENLRRVTNDIAHDLRSPLSRLRERLELARHEASDPAIHVALDDAIGQVDTCLAIFAALLRIAQIEAGARRSKFALVDMSALLCDLEETYEAVVETTGQTIVSGIASGLVMNGDHELLTQMFVNAIENAMQHSGAGSEISLTAVQNKDNIKIDIADTGPGIPKSEQNRVLQPFVRLDAARHSAGSGLGLALVKAVAELHDGDVELNDNHPGLRLSLNFPATRLI